MTVPNTAQNAAGAASAARLADPALLTGLALAVAAVLPLETTGAGSGSVLTALVLLALTIWAAPAVVARPAVPAFWTSILSRHRNTLFAAACTVLAALDHPAGWLAAVDAGLLLAYLVVVDARAAGPIGARQARSPVILPSAAVCIALTLTAALVPVDSGATWARMVAALAVAAAAALVGAAVWARRTVEPGAVLGPGAAPQPPQDADRPPADRLRS
jgi:hypothetical protein